MDEFAAPARQQQAAGPQEELQRQIVAALHTIRDPDIPVNIYDLGLVYGLDVSPGGEVRVRMTLTFPGCPMADSFPQAVRDALMRVPGVASVDVEMVWDPPWTPDRMSKWAKRELGVR